ncbi:hypothetical protein D3C81_2236410 [compost metagenome]
MTQIMKFSGMYVLDSQRIGLTGPDDYIRAALIPLTIIAVCLAAAVIFLEKKDIHI